MTIKTERFYRNKLQQYFNKKYLNYADTAEYYVDPDINVWKFDIYELGVGITLTCDDYGVVTETRKQLEGAVR